jgi:hypothetical protein
MVVGSLVQERQKPPNTFCSRLLLCLSLTTGLKSRSWRQMLFWRLLETQRLSEMTIPVDLYWYWVSLFFPFFFFFQQNLAFLIDRASLYQHSSVIQGKLLGQRFTTTCLRRYFPLFFFLFFSYSSFWCSD